MIIQNNFKTITFSVFFAEQKNQKTDMYRFLLSNVLLKTNDEYKTAKLFSRALENHYDAYFGVQNFDIKNYHILMYNFTFVHPTYVDEENFFEQSFNLFYETIFQRKIISEEVFQYEKRKMIEYYESILDNKNTYARERFFNEFYRNEKNYKQKLKVLKTITLTDIYNYYNELFQTNIIDYYISGNLNEKYTKAFTQKFNNNNSTIDFKLNKISKRKPRIIIENQKTEQAIIYLGYNLNPFMRKNDYEAAVLLDLYIGGFSESVLFKVIREEMGLCYSIRSNLNVNKGTLVINAGVDNKKSVEALNAITNLINELKTKEITDEEFLVLKNNFIHSYKQSRDSQLSVVRATYVNDKLKRDNDVNIKIKKILKVKKQEVMKLLNMLSLDTTYILEEKLEKN